MTRVSVNPARRQIRSAIAAFLSDYACEKGLKPEGARRRKDGAKSDSRLSSLPEPDLAWLENGRAIWRFYILPRPHTLRQLCTETKSAADAIICADSSGNVGIIEASQLLDFLTRRSISTDRTRIRSLARDIPSGSNLFPSFHFKGIIRKNHHFAKDHFSLRIRTGLVRKPVPGQFLQLMCDPAPHTQSSKYRSHPYSDGRLPKFRGMELLARHPFLRRPFSIASYGPPAERDRLKNTRRLGAEWTQLINWVESEFEIIYRRLPGGVGTGALAHRGVGDEIDVIGPLGKGFSLAPLPDVAFLAGGGIGSPPLLFLAEELARKGVETRVFLGALGKSSLPFQLRGAPKHKIPRFERLGLRPVICTDDGSAGYRGLATEPLAQYLERKRETAGTAKIFACGPKPMLAALDGIANRYALPCEVLLEERMACGFGACISCVCAAKETGQKARFTRICTEGPAFDVRTVMLRA